MSRPILVINLDGGGQLAIEPINSNAEAATEDAAGFQESSAAGRQAKKVVEGVNSMKGAFDQVIDQIIGMAEGLREKAKKAGCSEVSAELGIGFDFDSGIPLLTAGVDSNLKVTMKFEL